MAAFGIHVTGQQDAGACDVAGVDASAQRQRVSRIGAEVPNGGEPPSRQHFPHMRFERRVRRGGGVFPCAFRKMNVAVPEAGDHRLSRAIDDRRSLGTWSSLRLPTAVMTPFDARTTASAIGGASG